jgi:hypothetical protein
MPVRQACLARRSLGEGGPLLGRVRRSLFTRITRRCRAVRSLPLAPSSVPLIASLQCAAFIEKSELTTGGSLPACLHCLPPRRGPFPSSVIPSRGDGEGPPLGSDHPSSVYVLPSRLTRRVVQSLIIVFPSLHAPCSLLCPYTGGSFKGKRIRRRNSFHSSLARMTDIPSDTHRYSDGLRE